ncbi:hypothetical protein DICPUDRAFT_42752 [Dictyostelium purpureum]|uniref:NmrA-like domain-containing protein n=1 Tax=Dictyostelium purpureum TaxID=5786 RepID=F1A2Q8_DICPU|nr:uncharacterized protein DICPUDRAFT_42752 [Dictyostelium purpureum]EGC29524.1 hypothetical protein DICPUDRAFT_42752 [Dictyostelium purpureum]|eukprot:XP_003293950.1 hypothetical protein DICPUDRAFT_42752 [Dictyostelium purpureum]
MSILVTGASGKFGTISINLLLEKGVEKNKIIALGRDESKLEQFKEKGIQTRKADYNNYEELLSAFKGVEKLLFVSSNEVEIRTKQHQDVVKAAKEAGVKYIAYTSMIRKTGDGSSPVAFVETAHIETEKFIKESGIPYAILKNALYTDTLTEYFFGPDTLTNGIFFPLEQGSSNYATRRDLAEATINVILSSDQHQNKEYTLTGRDSPTLNDAIKVLSEIAGKELPYVSPDIDTYKKTVAGFGTPTHYINFLVAFALAIKAGEFSTDQSDLPKLLGKEQQSLENYLIEFYKKN